MLSSWWAGRWYFRFQLSFGDIEELLFKRGVTVMLSGGKGGNSGTCEREACVRQGGSPAEQPGWE